MRRILLAAITSSFFMAGSAALAFAQAEQKKEDPPHPKTLEELQKAMKDVVEKEHVTGAGVALVSNGQLLWCGGIGKADLAANRDVTCDTEFRVGSISKTFVALALLKLEEEGKINLYARLQDIAPEIPMKNRWASSNPVRIVNLLEHTAGFDDMELTEFYNHHGPENYPLLDVFKRFQEPQNVRWPPGTRFSYSNPDYGIAGYLIEKVSGQPFAAYIQQNLLAPLEITVGDFRLTDANHVALAQGYQGNPPRAAPYRNIYLRPAGDMKASPGELAKLVQFFLRRGMASAGQLVKPESIARMEYPETVSSSKNGLRLGYGLGSCTESTGGVITHGHDGGIDGFISSYRYMPEQNWGYVVLLNSTASGKALEDLNQLALNFLSKDFPKPQQPTVSLAPQELKKFTGYYAPRAPRKDVLFLYQPAVTKIRIRNGNLERSSLFGKSRETLLPVGKNLFRGEKEPEATAVFFPDASGRMIYVRSGENGMPYGERVFPLWIFACLLLLAASLVVMASALPYAFFWGLLLLLGKFIRKWKRPKHLRVRAVPLFAVLTLLAGALAFNKSLGSIGTWTFYFWSIIVWLASALFAILSLVGLALVVSVPRKEVHNWVRIHSLLVSIACCIIMLFLSSWHLLGVRLWSL